MGIYNVLMTPKDKKALSRNLTPETPSIESRKSFVYIYIKIYLAPWTWVILLLGPFAAKGVLS